jgi:excisionase family DNA binding protein
MATRPTAADLLARGETCSVEELASVLGLSRGATYAAVRAGTLPALHVGSRYLVPVRRILALLGADGGDAR